MDPQVWTPTQQKDTRFWTYLCKTPEHQTQVIIYHERKENTFPYLFFFNETVGVDHWWGGRQRFGHDHALDFGISYFAPDGSGEFVAAEQIHWMPHYGACYNEARAETLVLPATLQGILAGIPDTTVQKAISGAMKESAGWSDKDIETRIGAAYNALFKQYQEPAVLHDVREAVLKKLQERMKDSLFSHPRVAWEPSFTLLEATDKREYLLHLLRHLAGYDIHGPAAPKTQEPDPNKQEATEKLMGETGWTGVVGQVRDDSYFPPSPFCVNVGTVVEHPLRDVQKLMDAFAEKFRMKPDVRIGNVEIFRPSEGMARMWTNLSAPHAGAQDTPPLKKP